MRLADTGGGGGGGGIVFIDHAIIQETTTPKLKETRNHKLQGKVVYSDRADDVADSGPDGSNYLGG